MEKHSKYYVSPFESAIALANCVVWLVAAYFLYRQVQERRHDAARARAKAAQIQSRANMSNPFDDDYDSGNDQATRRRRPFASDEDEHEALIEASRRKWEYVKAKYGGGEEA
ncbi:hypothetical protein HRR83_008036 [Exophiala dermatitidis]|uniref:Uncharacterized protein n=2 Tax=Exophiala dermatitidis TaxID=5970 RepID=H6BPC2_EXODN|nr:uncharacterized protein HMPREF1120_02551 [Exophiala dermatitidis NIH/UT8656]KAJ4504958.1 hypothetical protein HRR74_008786 [Exophiala dermatitidis]EHY54382.1 hypothetical protein HMPREF1120_02551 [Exophiala dermatitidis NIH/UT8656]KAJ4513466.1 hypothetical protein HRR73_005624 [Exophiala dermatitidis]KAJ4535760.1 hypothetical protein HRR77_007705 [Exophiala dermatitidis]KAJ4541864.1 hypothetical protein HRR78_007142 [Exophiala dermatitidis]